MSIAYKDFISKDAAAVVDDLWYDWFANDSQLAPMTADLQYAAREVEAQLPTELQVFAMENPSVFGKTTHARLMFNEKEGGDAVASLEIEYPSGRVALYKAPDFETPVQEWDAYVMADPLDYEDENEELPEGLARSIVNSMVSEADRRSSTKGGSWLYDYRTGQRLRRATRKELQKSIEAAKHDGGAGVIQVDGRSCYATE
jgi:hypothetical protein